MGNTMNVLDSLVPITQFNRGHASRIFDRLRSEKQLFVLKNNQPAAVILSPAEYARLSEMEEDYSLMLEALKRLSDNTMPYSNREDVMEELGITQNDLDAAGDVIIE